MSGPVIAVHGGAGAIPSKHWVVYIDGVKNAAISGYKILEARGSALDAVETAVKCLEDNPYLNAGRGSSLTYDEQIEMDALIMDGSTLKAGAVGAIKNIANPITVARLVMEKTPHVLLVGEGANKFATMQGIQEVQPEELITEMAKDKLANCEEFRTKINCIYSGEKIVTTDHDTVGCTALDDAGHIACGTSTGGITAKMTGRVGDTPIIGAGGMADDLAGAVSPTGHGESIMRACFSKSVLDQMSSGLSPSAAIKSTLQFMENRIGGYGGAIALSASGEVGAEFSTKNMGWAYIKDRKLHYGISPGECIIEDLPN